MRERSKSSCSWKANNGEVPMDKWVLRPWEGNKSKHLQIDFECGRHTHDEVPQPGRLVARLWIEATTDDDSARYRNDWRGAKAATKRDTNYLSFGTTLQNRISFLYDDGTGFYNEGRRYATATFGVMMIRRRRLTRLWTSGRLFYADSSMDLEAAGTGHLPHREHFRSDWNLLKSH